MNKSKLSAILSLVLVFLSGGVLGAFAYRLYSASPVQTFGGGTPGGPPPKGRPEDFRKTYIANLTKELKLDGDQVKKLNVILDETRDAFNQFNEKSKAERDALNAQRNAFEDKWRPERDAIHNHQVEQITAMLRDDQRTAYAAYRAERDRQRKLRDQHKDGPPYKEKGRP
jgi:hypothetical protein